MRRYAKFLAILAVALLSAPSALGVKQTLATTRGEIAGWLAAVGIELAYLSLAFIEFDDDRKQRLAARIARSAVIASITLNVIADYTVRVPGGLSSSAMFLTTFDWLLLSLSLLESAPLAGLAYTIATLLHQQHNPQNGGPDEPDRLMQVPMQDAPTQVQDASCTDASMQVHQRKMQVHMQDASMQVHMQDASMQVHMQDAPVQVASAPMQDASMQVYMQDASVQVASAPMQVQVASMQDASRDATHGVLMRNTSNQQAHMQDASMQVQGASMQVAPMQVHMQDALMQVAPMQVHMQDAPMQVQDASMQVQDASVQVQDASMQVQDAPMQVHMQDALMQVASAPMQVASASMQVQVAPKRRKRDVPGIYTCPSCGTLLTRHEYAAAVRYNSCKQCRHSTPYIK